MTDKRKAERRVVKAAMKWYRWVEENKSEVAWLWSDVDVHLYKACRALSRKGAKR